MPEAGTNVLESFKTPYNFKGCRGRGLFYFTSDYDNLVPGLDDDDRAWPGTQPDTNDWVLKSDVDSIKARNGPSKVTGKPTGYFVVASRSWGKNNTIENNYGYRVHKYAVFHIY